MTDIPEQPQSSRLDRIEALLGQVAQQQANTQQQLDSFINTATSVLARSAILDGVVLELRESTENLQHNFEQHQRNFEEHQRNFQEHQRTTNAALQSLEAILLQLIRIFPQN
jgi:ABC-type transporter Mla subunit MlaD